MPQPDDTPDVELPVKKVEEEAAAAVDASVPLPGESKKPDAAQRAGRFRRFVGRQLRRGADAVDRRRAARAARG